MEDSEYQEKLADLEKVERKMRDANALFNHHFERTFVNPADAFDKFEGRLNEAHGYEILRYHVHQLGDMPRDPDRADKAIDSSLRLPTLYRDYLGLRDQANDLRAQLPARYDPYGAGDRVSVLSHDPEPWWVTPRTQTPYDDGAGGGHEIDRDDDCDDRGRR